MIVFELSCAEGHRFEGWFASSSAFEQQRSADQIACPDCGTPDVAKAPMAPAVSAKSNRTVVSKRGKISSETIQESGKAKENSVAAVANRVIPPELQKAMKALAKVQAKALKDSKWVGPDFAEKSRAIHYGEVKQEAIHGQATISEAQDLIDEGIAVAPLPFPIASPEELN